MIYDIIGNLTSYIDELERTTLYQYNNADNVTQTTDPLGWMATYSYDANKRLIKHKEFTGAVPLFITLNILIILSIIVGKMQGKVARIKKKV